MKIKHTWLPMILLLLAGGGLKLCHTVFAANSADFFLSADMTNFVFGGCVAAMLIITFLVSLADKKVQIVNRVSKNIPAAIFGFIASISILGIAALKVIELVTNGSESLVGDVASVFIALFGSVVLLYESCILFTGINKLATMPLLALCVPLWYCSRTISLFAEYSKTSIRSTEIFDFVAVVLMLLFFYHQSVYFAQLKEKRSPIKLFIFGMPMVLCTLVAVADMIVKSFLNNTWSDMLIVQYVGDIAVSFYALFLMYGSLKETTLAIKNADGEQNSKVSAHLPSAPSSEEIKSILIENTDKDKKEDEQTSFSKETKNVSEEMKPENDESEKTVPTKEEPKAAAPFEVQTAETNAQVITEKSVPAEQNVRHTITSNEPISAPVVPIAPAETPKKAVSHDDIDDLLKELDD